MNSLTQGISSQVNVPASQNTQTAQQASRIGVYTPFVSCIIGSGDTAINIGTTGLEPSNTKHGEPQFIQSLSFERIIGDADKGNDMSAIFQCMREYVVSMSKEEELSKEEAKAATNKADAAKKKAEAVKKLKKDAGKVLDEKLLSIAGASVACKQGGLGTATIEINFIHNLKFMMAVYNLNLAQDMTPDITFQFGVRGVENKVSQVYQGLIDDITVRDWYQMTIHAIIAPGKYIAWDPEQFNAIFGDKKSAEGSAKNNQGSQKVTTSADQVEYGKEATITQKTVKVERYSDIVQKIADGLGWEVGEIVKTTKLPKEIFVTVENMTDGPLQYIIKNYCGTKDEKDSKGKTFKAGAVSEKDSSAGYTAYIDYVNGTTKFYYVPKLYVLQNMINNMSKKVFEYEYMGDNNGCILNLQFDPVNLKTTQINLLKKDGKGKIESATVNGPTNEMHAFDIQAKIDKGKGSQSYTATNVTKATDTTSGQNPTDKITVSAQGIQTLSVNAKFFCLNTWLNGNATMTILYEPNIQINDVVTVIAYYTVNDSAGISKFGQTKQVHPSSGTYKVMGITDNISASTATTTLKLMKLPMVNMNITEKERKNLEVSDNKKQNTNNEGNTQSASAEETGREQPSTT